MPPAVLAGPAGKLLTRGEVARRLCLSVTTVRRMERVQLKPIVGERGVRYFEETEIQTVLVRVRRIRVPVDERVNGTLAAAAFTRFRNGADVVAVVTELRVAPERIESLFEHWKRLRGTVLLDAMSLTALATDSPYPKVVDSDGVIMAFPTAIGDWNMGPCCADDVDDIGFAKALVSEVEGLGFVDPQRVYGTGFSMGGAMSHQLACQAADVFAAVAPSAFDLLEEHLATCKPKRPITVITFRGTQDSLAVYNGGLSNLCGPSTSLGPSTA